MTRNTHSGKKWQLRVEASNSFPEAFALAKKHGVHLVRFTPIHYRLEKPDFWSLDLYPTTRNTANLKRDRHHPQVPPCVTWREGIGFVQFVRLVVKAPPPIRTRWRPEKTKEHRANGPINDRGEHDPRFRMLCIRCSENFGERSLGGFCDECQQYGNKQ